MGDATPWRRNVAVFLDMENLVGTCPGGKSQLKLGEVVTAIEHIVRTNWTRLENCTGACLCALGAAQHGGFPAGDS